MANSNPSRLSSKLLDLAVILLILSAAFIVSYIGGQVAMPLSPALTFDGGYRVFSGQILFKDFVSQHSLALFWLVALFFKLLGVNYVAFLVCAASMSVVATLCSMMTVRILFPQKYLSYIAGFLTAIWFNAPFGIPVPEQISLAFSFIAIALILPALCGKSRRSIINMALLFTGGIFAFATLLGKQNTGFFAIPLFLMLIIAASISEARPAWGRIAVFLLGISAAASLFLSWLVYKSDLNNFLRYYILLPFGVGAGRFGTLFNESLKMHKPYALLTIAVPAVVVALYFCNFKKVRSSWRLPFISSVLCIGAFLFQLFFFYTSVYPTSYSFVGIVASLETGLLFHFFDLSIPESAGVLRSELKIPPRKILIVLVSMLLIVCAVRGVRYAFKSGWITPIMSLNALKEPNLQPMKWAESSTEDNPYKAENIDNLASYLRKKDRNFFTFPYLFAMLYGALGKPSPQPLVEFAKRLTYPEVYDARLDNWIVDDLKKNEVEIVVLHRIDPDNYDGLDDFPLLKSYIFDNFLKVKEIGHFDVYEMNGKI
ncbi:MAG: hypothetical protein V2A66_01425 [Pseudomonadota bacterium]